MWFPILDTTYSCFSLTTSQWFKATWDYGRAGSHICDIQVSDNYMWFTIYMHIWNASVSIFTGVFVHVDDMASHPFSVSFILIIQISIFRL